jgi:uncharacterized protein YndB with AHSA1/START domain
MGVKKDASGRRWVEVEIEIPGEPEEVWDAIATGPGVTSWFVPTKSETREDGTVIVTSNFGPGMDVEATQTAWDPPRRFAAESSGFGPEGPSMATEWIVEARSGGICVVRVVHSLFASTDEWDNQLKDIESGWPIFFRILQLYIAQFPGRYAKNAHLSGMFSGSGAEAWKKLTGALGVKDPKAGKRSEASTEAPSLAGVVELVKGSQMVLSLEEPADSILHLLVHPMGEQQALVMIRFYLYGDAAKQDAQQIESTWSAWMNREFPMAGGGEPSC